MNLKGKIIKLVFLCLICIITMAFCSNDLIENKCIIYKIGDNSITKEIKKSEIDLYINDKYEWSIEPSTFMFTADGRTSWICNSEVSIYEKNGWSTKAPVTIYSHTGEKTVLVEELSDYLATGEWSEIKPINITMNPFQKTNLSPEELERVLTKGLSGYGQAFYDMERWYGINSIFAISVAELESGYGTSSAFRRKNNAFGIGSGKRFSDVEAGIEYFGQLMNKSLYYGKSIDKIGSIYCACGNWSSKVKSLMNNNYRTLGY